MQACFRVPFKVKLRLVTDAMDATDLLCTHVETCKACNDLNVEGEAKTLDDVTLCDRGNALNAARMEQQKRARQFGEVPTIPC